MRKRFKPVFRKKLYSYLNLNNFFINMYTRFLYKNLFLPDSYRQAALLFLVKFNKNIFFSSLNYACLETGKSRGIILNFKISYLIFKLLLTSCFLTGVYRYSW